MPQMVITIPSFTYGDTTIENFLSLDTSDLTPYMVKAIQEQQDQINSLSQNMEGLNLTESGDLKIITVADSSTSEESKPTSEVFLGDTLIDRIGAFSETVAGKIRSGLIETQELITENLIAKNIVSKEKIISPLAEFEELRANKIETNQIKPKTTSQNSKLSITDSTNQPTAEFDTETKTTTLFGDLTIAGNVGIGQSLNANQAKFNQISAQRASFGDLLAQNVSISHLEAESVKTQSLETAQDATIAGTIYANRIIAREGGFGQLLGENVSVESIKSIVKEEIATAATQSAETAEEDEEELDLEALIKKVEEWAGTSTKNDLSLDCGDIGANGIDESLFWAATPLWAILLLPANSLLRALLSPKIPLTPLTGPSTCKKWLLTALIF